MKFINNIKTRLFVIIVFMFLLVCSIGGHTQQKSSNPLEYSLNEIIDFKNLHANHIAESADNVVAESKMEFGKVYKIPDNQRTFDNTLLPLDDYYERYASASGIISLMANAHPDSAIRAQALASNQMLNEYDNEVNLDERLYKAIKAYSQTEEAQQLTGYKKKFLDETVRDFERNGFALPKEKRDQLKTIQDKISEIGLQFDKNIAEEDDFLIVSEEEIDGLPEDYKNARRTEDGQYRIDLSYPSYFPFMQYSASDKARKALYMKYTNRAAATNLEVLKNLIIERDKMAQLLGYKTYAAYRVEDRMAKSPKRVWDFENNLIDQLKVKAQKDYQEILDAKRTYLKDPYAKKINNWESSFYKNILLKEKYQLDNEKLKEYFELNHVLSGLFQITQHLFGIEFQEIPNPSVWHEDVRLFDVKENGKLLGCFYLDLYPRPNKYSHAACFQMVMGKMTAQGYQVPSATLECNFPRPTEERPSLLPHSQVVTFFHEFGHVMHHILSHTELSAQTGFGVSLDFVEAPSQLLENWAWDYESLKLFAKHYQTGEVLPKELHDCMLAAKNVDSGNYYLAQVFYGIIDFTLYDGYDPIGKETTTDVVKRLQNRILLYPYVEGTNLQTAFGHLNGYAAGYYGYLWAKVYAEDIFSIFEENGLMNQETGLRYRDTILARGATMDELEMVKEFLGREPQQNAFIKSLGL